MSKQGKKMMADRVHTVIVLCLVSAGYMRAEKVKLTCNETVVVFPRN